MADFDVVALGIALKMLGVNNPYRITCTIEGFVVELFSDSTLAKFAGMGIDSNFSIAYQKAINELKRKSCQL